MRRTCLALLVSLGIAPAEAAAFSEYEQFEISALEGGGGGRYFTGSFNDGYSCNVCHRGEAPPRDGELSGLPTDGYAPGETYALELELPDGASAGAAVEITDENGNGMGTLELIGGPQPADLCLPVDGAPAEEAAHLSDLPQSRRMATVDGCGATRLRFTWTAPATPPGPMWIHAGVVASDGSGDPTGDGVLLYSQVIPPFGDRAESSRVGSACAASPARAVEPTLLGLLALLTLVARGRRRRA